MVLSKVSFRFVSETNLKSIKERLEKYLNDVKYCVIPIDEKIGNIYFGFRIYVYSSDKKEKVMSVCKRIKMDVIYDTTQEITT